MNAIRLWEGARSAWRWSSAGGACVDLRDQRGATLVELLVGLSVTTGIILLIGTAVIQFFHMSRWGNDKLFSLNEMQVIGLWLGRDVVESESFNPGSGSEYGTFRWPGGSHQFTYEYDPAQGAIMRKEIIDGVVESQRVVARHIASQTDANFSEIGGLVTVSITTSVGDVSDTMTWQWAMRAR